MSLLLLSMMILSAEAFLCLAPLQHRPQQHLLYASKQKNVVEEDNWIEQVSDNSSNKDEDWEEYNIGIQGLSLQTGPLSKKFYHAMIQNKQKEEEDTAYKLLALDYTAREATRVSCEQNGFILLDSDDDWGKVEQIQLIDPNKGRPLGNMHGSWADFLPHWKPGLGFNFVAKGIKAKGMEYNLQDVLSSLDTDGSWTEQMQESGMEMPTEDLKSLRDLSNDINRRVREPPMEASTDDTVYRGDKRKGYNAIKVSDLMVAPLDDASRYEKTLMHVMDAWVSHGCLIVELEDPDEIQTLSQLWQTTKDFFHHLEEDSKLESTLPKMQSIPASPYAKLGYANFGNGMKFLETRLQGQTSVLPELSSDITLDTNILAESFGILSRIGNKIVQVATAASSVEHGGFDDDADAYNAAQHMVQKLVDQGEDGEEVSMSPHRLCCYSSNNNDGNDSDDTKELFGAHTDTSFATIVPVAAVSGLEVWDEDVRRWYRPELKARQLWETSTGGNADDNNWHARYVVVMPGEFLQIVSRNEIAAAVHRVVSPTRGESRLSAPILLRGRPGQKMVVSDYLGHSRGDPLLEQVNGMELQDIHNALQPNSKK